MYLIIVSIIAVIFFRPIYEAKEIIIQFGIRPFDICKENPTLWEYIKKTYIITYLFSSIVIYKIINNLLIKILKNTNQKNIVIEKQNFKELKLLIGYDEILNQNIFIPEKGLYQNFLITGTIGTGKTSSAMYPFTRQLIEYNYNNAQSKIGMLILDVKGNYYNQVKKYAKKFNLEKDLIVLELKSKIKYNPLHKPRIKTTNFSQ